MSRDPNKSRELSHAKFWEELSRQLKHQLHRARARRKVDQCYQRAERKKGKKMRIGRWALGQMAEKPMERLTFSLCVVDAITRF